MITQTFSNWELFIVADGCEKTFEIVKQSYNIPGKVRCVMIKKEPIWSGRVRNYALHHGKGEYALYLDIDDYFGPDHLKTINEEIGKENLDWVYFNDLIAQKDGSIPHSRLVNIDKTFGHGTSNICHKRNIAWWKTEGDYAHDYEFVQSLKIHRNFKRISTPQYVCCHIPNELDV